MKKERGDKQHIIKEVIKMKGERNAVGVDSLIAIFFYSFILHLFIAF